MYICQKCGKKIKQGEWYATPWLHYDCCTQEDLDRLRKEAEERRKKVTIKNIK